MPPLLLSLILLGQTPDSMLTLSGIRDPAYAADGRLAFEHLGDVWIWTPPTNGSVTEGGLRVVTSGPAWDRDPAWLPDGAGLVFVSDRTGISQLWTVELTSLEVTRVTNADIGDGQPTVGPDGTIVFVRGAGSTADLWIKPPDRAAARLTDRAGAERAPAFSADGREVAYVSVINDRRTLRRLALDTGQDDSVLEDSGAERPVWSPDGTRLIFTTRQGERGVWVTSRTGTYTNLVTPEPAAVAWSPDGRHLALATLAPRGPGYNGDPDRVGDREVGDLLDDHGRLHIVAAPTPPPALAEHVALPLTTSRAAYNARVFDQVWTRLERLYGRGVDDDRWRAIRDRFRPRGVAAATATELDAILHEMVTSRPHARPEATGSAGVSSAHPAATAAGAEILALGGNVVDAAVAVSFAIGVVEPDASGIGGYGEMVVYLQSMPEPVVIEFLTRVPEHASLSNAALLVDGDLPEDGPVLANVPGTVAGMELAWERYGSGNVTWEQLLAPAIRLADEGFELDDAFTTTLRVERERFLQYDGSRALFFPGGEPLQAGDTLRNPDLAWTLRQIAAHGAEAFYRGEVAARMVADLRGHGNAMTESDLARYFAVEREPVRGTYRGHTVYSGAPAVSGGASLVSKLHLLDQGEHHASYRDDAPTFHAMIEAWKLAPSTRGYVADPSLWPVNLLPFESRDSARVRWRRCFDPTRSSQPQDLRTGPNGGPRCADTEVARSWGEDVTRCETGAAGCRATGTTAFAVADAAGNAVAVTQTLGTWGGTFHVTPGLGFLYNDKLRSYSSNPASYNARIPFARNSTSIAPTLVFRGTGADRRPFLAVGAAGNAWIGSAVYQTVTAMIDGGLGPQAALELPRFLVTNTPGARPGAGREVTIQIEDGIAPDVLRNLEAMGHRFQRISLRGELRMGYGAAVMIDGNRVRAGADPRRSGSAAAIP